MKSIKELKIQILINTSLSWSLMPEVWRNLEIDFYWNDVVRIWIWPKRFLKRPHQYRSRALRVRNWLFIRTCVKKIKAFKTKRNSFTSFGANSADNVHSFIFQPSGRFHYSEWSLPLICCLKAIKARMRRVWNCDLSLLFDRRIKKLLFFIRKKLTFCLLKRSLKVISCLLLRRGVESFLTNQYF